MAVFSSNVSNDGGSGKGFRHRKMPAVALSYKPALYWRPLDSICGKVPIPVGDSNPYPSPWLWAAVPRANQTNTDFGQSMPEVPRDLPREGPATRRACHAEIARLATGGNGMGGRPEISCLNPAYRDPQPPIWSHLGQHPQKHERPNPRRNPASSRQKTGRGEWI